MKSHVLFESQLTDMLVNAGTILIYLTGLAESEELDDFQLESQFSGLKSEIHANLLANAGLREVISDTGDDRAADHPALDDGRGLAMALALGARLPKEQVRVSVGGEPVIEQVPGPA